jgi:hypothetical protein
MTAYGSVTLTICAKVGTEFADKRRSLGRYVLSRTQVTEFSFRIEKMSAALEMKVTAIERAEYEMETEVQIWGNVAL